MGVAYVVRHAKAGDRSDWSGDDRLRPLTKSGQRQAEALADMLEGEPIDRVLSSGYLRCMKPSNRWAPVARSPSSPSRTWKKARAGRACCG